MEEPRVLKGFHSSARNCCRGALNSTNISDSLLSHANTHPPLAMLFSVGGSGAGKSPTVVAQSWTGR
jgi:hypothetical protein